MRALWLRGRVWWRRIERHNEHASVAACASAHSSTCASAHPAARADGHGELHAGGDCALREFAMHGHGAGEHELGRDVER